MGEIKFKPKLIETEYSYEVRIPKFKDNQYLIFSKMIATTLLDDDTRMGHGDKTLLIKTCESFEYLQKTLATLLRISRSNPIKLENPIAICDLPIGSKFVAGDKNFRVYKRVIQTEKDISYNKIRGVYNSDSLDSDSSPIMLRPDLFVYAVETEDDFLNYKI